MLPRLLCAIVIGDVVRASVDGVSLDHTATRLEVGADMAARKLISSVSSRTRGGSVPLGVAHDIIRQHAFTVPECVRPTAIVCSRTHRSGHLSGWCSTKSISSGLPRHGRCIVARDASAVQRRSWVVMLCTAHQEGWPASDLDLDQDQDQDQDQGQDQGLGAGHSLRLSQRRHLYVVVQRLMLLQARVVALLNHAPTQAVLISSSTSTCAPNSRSQTARRWP